MAEAAPYDIIGLTVGSNLLPKNCEKRWQISCLSFTSQKSPPLKSCLPLGACEQYIQDLQAAAAYQQMQAFTQCCYHLDSVVSTTDDIIRMNNLSISDQDTNQGQQTVTREWKFL